MQGASVLLAVAQNSSEQRVSFHGVVVRVLPSRPRSRVQIPVSAKFSGGSVDGVTAIRLQPAITFTA